MKNLLFKIQAVGLTAFLFLHLSCSSDFLEITPKGKLIANSVADYNLLLSNLDLLNMYTDAQVLLGDEIAAVEPYFSGSDLRTQRLYRYEDVIYEPDEDATEMRIPMTNIYLFNKIIAEIGDATDGTEAQKKMILAEARAGRAWTYHLLINYYGKPYEESTAANDPGFPIIKNADVTETKFKRASVKEVYDFIVEDLKESIPNLSSGTYHRTRMSTSAAKGILGKVYMHMGKFEEAEEMLSSAISDVAAAQVPVKLYDYNITFAKGGAFLPIGIFGPAYPTLPNNQENIYAKQFGNSWSFTDSEIVMNQQTKTLFTPSDMRLNFYSTNVFNGATYPNGLLRRIGPGTTLIGLLLPDLYLMRAECRARAGNLGDAVQDVELLRQNRMPAADAKIPATIAIDHEKLVRFILEERVREFACQGYRWFDMRRLSVDPVYKTTVGEKHIVYASSGAVSNTFTLKPERLVLRFPQKIIIQNPEINNNP